MKRQEKVTGNRNRSFAGSARFERLWGGSAAPSSAAQPSETKKEEAQKQAEAAGAESSAGDADYTQEILS